MQQLLAGIDTLTARLQADPRILAGWLEGSFGRGDADAYSDIDLHVLLGADELAGFQPEAWLAAIWPLVLCTTLFDGRMINALTADGVRIDLWLHGGERAAVQAGKARVLHDPHGVLDFTTPVAKADDQALAAGLEAQIKEFWRCIALLPVVLGRDEKIVALQGVAIEVGILTNVLIKGYRIERDAGVKKLNAFLPGNTRAAIESALAMDGLTRSSLVRTQLALAGIMQQHGPGIAQAHGFAYPGVLEKSVLGLVQDC